ncbi:hypothetical protein P8605_04800 [Streptomyces sp. T-3]|nr:hypothetical protein [Streptomyces sp. T-3]
MAVAIALVGGGLWFLLGGGSDGPDLTDDGKNYELTAPHTVLGEYKLKSPGETDADITYEQMKDLGIKRAHAIDAEYEGGVLKDGLMTKDVDLDGLWGEIADPQKTLDRAMALSTQGMSPEEKAVVSAEQVEPEGLDNAVMKCQVIKRTGDQQESWCIWADYSTIGMVEAQEDGRKLTIDEAAQLASDLRAEVRREVQ